MLFDVQGLVEAAEAQTGLAARRGRGGSDAQALEAGEREVLRRPRGPGTVRGKARERGAGQETGNRAAPERPT